jgi:CRISPR-associated protein Csb2
MHLLIEARIHDGRFHGAGEWAPSPARLFQALVAAAPRGGQIDSRAQHALSWLEQLAPPIVATPLMTQGQRVQSFVPNNDLDAVAADIDRVGEVRTSKVIAPLLFDASVPFLFAWTFEATDEASAHVARLIALAEAVHQLGRGVDMAYGMGRVVDDAALNAVLRVHRGPVYRPGGPAAKGGLRCPHPGSFRSLEERHRATLARFTTVGSGIAAITLFAQPPKPSFANISYDDAPKRILFDLQRPDGSFAPWPLRGAAALAAWVRDGIAARLRGALRGDEERVELAVVGRKGSDARRDGRIQIVPIPSIGHEHVDRSIRRVMISIPARCPVGEDDVAWAASGLELGDPDTGVVSQNVLTSASTDDMLKHYGLGEVAARIWRSITPAALPEPAARRRIEPRRLREEAKGAAECSGEEARARHAVIQALRHAGAEEGVVRIHVQREPFAAGEERAERFAGGHRFPKERLWHVEVEFDRPRRGPLVIGDGRYLALGVMHPMRRARVAHVFAIEGERGEVSPIGLSRAMRRAVMARVQLRFDERLPTFFSGHRDSGPGHGDDSAHVAFQYDPSGRRVIVLAPADASERYLAILDEALAGMSELRAGELGLLRLRPLHVADDDPLFRRSSRWKALTPYVVTRHPRRMTAAEAVAEDLRVECSRRGLRTPRVLVRETSGVPGMGLVAMVDLTFDVPVAGPIALGRTRNLGGGLFCAT